MLHAAVTSVRPRQLGDCLAAPAAAGATTVRVTDGQPFTAVSATTAATAGGVVALVDIVGMRATVTEVTVNADSTSTLKLAAPLPAAADTGDPVRVVNGDGTPTTVLYAIGNLAGGDGEFAALLTGEQEGRFPVGFIDYEPDGWLVTLNATGDRIVKVWDRTTQQRSLQAATSGPTVGMGEGRDADGNIVPLVSYDPGTPLFNRGSTRTTYTPSGQIAAIATRGPTPVGFPGKYATHELAATAAGGGGSQQRLAADVITLDAHQLQIVLDGVVHNFADILAQLGGGA